MRKLVLSSFVSLDGVAEAPESWQEPFWSDALQRYCHKLLFASDALLLGRRTYELFASAWPNHTDAEGFADRMNEIPKHVASRSAQSLEWTNSTRITGDLAESVGALKRAPGQDILIFGSLGLARSLMRLDLIDSYHLWMHPVVIGNGTRLFADGAEAPSLRLVDHNPFDSGVVILTYEPAG